MAVQRLDILAHNQASKMMFRHFSAMYHLGSWDSRVYLPVSEQGKSCAYLPDYRNLHRPNGNNADQLWLEHPEQNPFTWTCPRDIAEVRDALRLFEQLLVLPQACEVPEMRWLVGMAEGFFPIVRDVPITDS